MSTFRRWLADTRGQMTGVVPLSTIRRRKMGPTIWPRAGSISAITERECVCSCVTPAEVGADGGARTPTPSRVPDFESSASANSATSATAAIQSSGSLESSGKASPSGDSRSRGPPADARWGNCPRPCESDSPGFRQTPTAHRCVPGYWQPQDPLSFRRDGREARCDDKLYRLALRVGLRRSSKAEPSWARFSNGSAPIWSRTSR